MEPLLATFGLGPVLFWQGRCVRQRLTPQLPEPAGLRQGVVGSGLPLRLLIAGDSAAAGVGASTQDEALSGQLVGALAPHFNISWKLIAKTGHTTPEALASLEQAPAEPFDVAVISLGVNDLTEGCAIPTWLSHQARLVQLLKHKFQTRCILLSGLPPMRAFPALPQPLRWYLGMQATRFNAALSRWALGNGDAEFCPAIFPEDLRLMASDGFHPGAAAYSFWGRHLADRICRQMAAGAYAQRVSPAVAPEPIHRHAGVSDPPRPRVLVRRRTDSVQLRPLSFESLFQSQRSP